MVGEIMSIQIGTFAQSTNIYVEFYDFSLYSFEVCVCVCEWIARYENVEHSNRHDDFTQKIR